MSSELISNKLVNLSWKHESDCLHQGLRSEQDCFLRGALCDEIQVIVFREALCDEIQADSVWMPSIPDSILMLLRQILRATRSICGASQPSADRDEAGSDYEAHIYLENQFNSCL